MFFFLCSTATLKRIKTRENAVSHPNPAHGRSKRFIAQLFKDFFSSWNSRHVQFFFLRKSTIRVREIFPPPSSTAFPPSSRKSHFFISQIVCELRTEEKRR